MARLVTRQSKALLSKFRFSTVAATSDLLSPPKEWQVVCNEEHFGHREQLLKRRRYLAGSFADTFPTTLGGPRENFPYTLQLTSNGIKPSNSLELLGQDVKPFVSSALDKYGAVLLKGVPLAEKHDFGTFYDSLGYGRANYIGGLALRTRLLDNIYAASLEPCSLDIEPHNELSYLQQFPDKITFFCLKPPLPGNGGETVLTKNEDILHNLDPAFVAKVKRKKLRYVQTYHSKSSGHYLGHYMLWEDGFNTSRKEDVESVLDARGCKWSWLENDKLQYSYISDAFFTHPWTKEEIWYNQCSAAHVSYFKHHPLYENIPSLEREPPFHCQYGDGEEIELKYLQQIRDAAWGHSVAIPWDHGDVLIANNLCVQHARMSFKGERTLMVALSEKMHAR